MPESANSPVAVCGACLAGLDLRGLNLQGARLNNADLHGSFLQGVDLRQAQMSGVNLTGADLTGANLQQAVLRDSTLANANLIDTRLTGTDLAGSDLRGTTGLTWVQVRDAAIACSTQLPTVLPPTNRDTSRTLPMLLVLRDCLLPAELRIISDSTTFVLFGTVLRDPVAVVIPDLDVTVEVHSPTQTEGRALSAREGTYPIRAEVAIGAPPLTGTLRAENHAAVALRPEDAGDGDTTVTRTAGTGEAVPTWPLGLPTDVRDEPENEETVFASIDDPFVEGLPTETFPLATPEATADLPAIDPMAMGIWTAVNSHPRKKRSGSSRPPEDQPSISMGSMAMGTGSRAAW